MTFSQNCAILNSNPESISPETESVMKATEGLNKSLNRLASFLGAALVLGAIAMGAAACGEQLELGYYIMDCPENAGVRTYTGKNGKRGDTLAAKWCADVVNGKLNGRIVIVGPHKGDELIGNYAQGVRVGDWYQREGQNIREYTFKDGHIARAKEGVTVSNEMVLVRESEVVCSRNQFDYKTSCWCVHQSVYPDKTKPLIINSEGGDNCDKDLPFQADFVMVNTWLGKPVE